MSPEVDLVVSIVVASYNHARFVGEAIRSALDQTYDRTEVIVVDDGSTDHSRQIIESYASDIRYVIKANGGQASAWYVGAALATGSWLIFLDSDDRLLPHVAAAVVAAARAGTRPAKIHWPLALIDEHGDSLGLRIPEVPLAAGDRFAELVDYGFDRGPNQPTSGNAWRADFVDHVLPMPAELFRISADTFLLGLSPLFGPTVAVPEVCAEYRCHSDNNGACGSVRSRAADVVRRSTFVFNRVARELADRGVPASLSTWSHANPVFTRWLRLAEGGNDA